MADSFLDTPELTSAKESSYAATESAGQMAANAYKMPDLLRQAVSERFKQSPLHGQFQGAAQQFLTAVPEKRAELASMVQGGGPILNPNQQQSILAGTRAANLVPLISLNDLLKSQMGGIDTLVGAGTNAYNSQVAAAQAAAELKRQQYQDILNELVKSEELRQSGLKASGGGGTANWGDLFGGLGGDDFIPDENEFSQSDYDRLMSGKTQTSVPTGLPSSWMEEQQAQQQSTGSGPSIKNKVWNLYQNMQNTPWIDRPSAFWHYITPESWWPQQGE